MSSKAPGLVIANAGRWNWASDLNLAALEEVVSVASCPADHPSDDEILALLSDETAVLITKEIPVTPALIGRLPASVKLLVEAGTGFNNVAMDAAKERGITVCNVPAYSQDAVAHLVVTFVLNHSCSLVEQQQLIQAGDRSNGFAAPLRTPHFELGGQTIGLIGGSGNIGSKVASVAVALGMKVLVSSRTPPAEEDASGGGGIETIGSMDELLQRSDFVSIHCPLNESTRHLIDAEKLKLMKPTALLINTARGESESTAAAAAAAAACVGHRG
jgi:glycerate dehydrogenase